MSPATTGSGEPALSAQNPKVQHLRRLIGRRKSRREHGQFVVEGPTLVTEALAAGSVVAAVFVDADGNPDTLAPTRIAAEQAGVPVHQLGPGVLARIADTVTPQPAVAIVEGRPLPLDALVSSERRGLVVVLAGVADPGNAGTVIRAAEAAGATAVVFTEGSVDPLGPKTVRAAAGSALRVPVVEGTEVAATVAALRGAGWRAVGTVATGATPYTGADLTGDVAVVLGSEAHGLPADVVAELDELVTIPMQGQVESLNVAVAGALLCFEHARPR